ncbi:MAG: endonuclease/exonuclease/phosphatase family protein [Desulfuromonadales bacterium]
MMPGIWREILWLILWAGALGTMTTFALRWLGGDQYLAGRLAGYFMPWLLAVLLPGLLIAMVAQRKWLALALGAPIALIVITYAPLFLPASEERPPAALKVMSYNIWSHNEDMAAAAAVIRREQPDILMLQEINSRQLGRLQLLLDDLHPSGALHIIHDDDLLQAVVSRFPVVPLESLRHRGQAQQARIATTWGPVTVFNVHPLRHGGWHHRYRQIVALLKEEVLDEQGPTILAGDFNVNDQTQLYRKITRYLRDAHWQAGFGFGFTFPADASRFYRKYKIPPLIRIDHIFYSPHFLAQNARTLQDSGGSDHYPVVAELIPPAIRP